jgi:hypothetical protein
LTPFRRLALKGWATSSTSVALVTDRSWLAEKSEALGGTLESSHRLLPYSTLEREPQPTYWYDHTLEGKLLDLHQLEGSGRAKKQLVGAFRSQAVNVPAI